MGLKVRDRDEEMEGLREDTDKIVNKSMGGVRTRPTLRLFLDRGS